MKSAHKALDIVYKRYSPRAFNKASVTDSELGTLFDAARWAASSFNDQPWHFVVLRKEHRDQYNKVFDSLTEFNQAWAGTAPVLILVVARDRFSHNGSLNRHAWYDAGQAVAQMTLQAAAMDLYLHQMGGFDAEVVKKTGLVPEGYMPVVIAALGREGDINDLPAEVQKVEKVRLRSRKPLDEIVTIVTPKK